MFVLIGNGFVWICHKNIHKCRKLYERDHSIRERIAKAKEQLKYPTTDEQKNKRENHVKRGEHSL